MKLPEHWLSPRKDTEAHPEQRVHCLAVAGQQGVHGKLVAKARPLPGVLVRRHSLPLAFLDKHGEQSLQGKRLAQDGQGGPALNSAHLSQRCCARGGELSAVLDPVLQVLGKAAALDNGRIPGPLCFLGNASSCQWYALCQAPSAAPQIREHGLPP